MFRFFLLFAKIFRSENFLIQLLCLFLDFLNKTNRFMLLFFYYERRLLFLNLMWNLFRSELLVIHYFRNKIFCQLLEIRTFIFKRFFAKIYRVRWRIRFTLLNSRHTVFLLFVFRLIFQFSVLLIFKFIRQNFIDRW